MLSETPQGAKSSNEDATMLSTATATVNDTNNVVVSIPGFLKLRPDDFTTDRGTIVGQGGSATIFKGKLSPGLQRRHGFRAEAIKIYDGSEQAAKNKFELAIMNTLQKRSRHIATLVGYAEYGSDRG